jgi:hypothetical protein
MKHHLDLDLNDPEMRAARARLADEVAARKKQAEAPPADYFERRLAEARAAVAPLEPITYCFVPREGGYFQVIAITAADLEPKTDTEEKL